MTRLIILSSIVVIMLSLLSGANNQPLLVGGGGTPSNALVFPIFSPRPYLQSDGSGNLKISAVTAFAPQYWGFGPSATTPLYAGHAVGDAQNGTTIANTTIAVNDTDASAGGTNGGRLFRFFNRRNTGYLSQNFAYVSTTTGNLDQTGSPGLEIQINNGGAITVSTATAGTNPRTLSTEWVLGTTALTFPDASTQSTAAPFQASYQPGLILSIANTKSGYYLVSHGSTVDNITGSTLAFTCSVNPTVTMFECGTSTTCASPTTIGTVTMTSGGTAFVGTVSNPAITAGDYIAWATTAGTCSAYEPSITAQVHTN